MRPPTRPYTFVYKFGQWHTTACICTSLPPQHTYARMVRLVFGSLHHVLSIKCKYRRFGGPVLWIQHHEILLVLCMSSSFHKLESAMVYTSRSAITVGVQHIWRQPATAEVWLPPFVVWKTAIRNAICHYYPAIRNSPSLPYDRQPLLLIARGCHFFRTPIFTEILQQRRWGQLINKVTAIRQPVHMHIHFTVLYMVFKRSDGPT